MRSFLGSLKGTYPKNERRRGAEERYLNEKYQLNLDNRRFTILKRYRAIAKLKSTTRKLTHIKTHDSEGFFTARSASAGQNPTIRICRPINGLQAIFCCVLLSS